MNNRSGSLSVYQRNRFEITVQSIVMEKRKAKTIAYAKRRRLWLRSTDSHHQLETGKWTEARKLAAEVKATQDRESVLDERAVYP